MISFTEVRLQPVAACRAWVAERGCFSALEWERELATTPGLRACFEEIRLRVSEALAVDGIDPLGIMRKLLIHESAASLSRSWLREVGFVHLDAASGIHLYALWRAYERGLEFVAARVPRWTAGIRRLRVGVPVVGWIVIFGLTGMRPGLVRPLILVGMRWGAERFGFRWTKGSPLLIALLVDAGLAFLMAYGRERTFSDWAPGEAHYALAWWGGVLGYEWARRRSYGPLRAHAVLSVASWLSVLPLDLVAGHFALATPILSWITIEFLARGGYVALIACVLIPDASIGLQWMSVLLNRAIGAIASFLSNAGGVRELSPELGLPLALGLGAVLLFLCNDFSSLKKYDEEGDSDLRFRLKPE